MELPAPWKNGGGVTHEVATFPVDASIEDFKWRLSIADVDAAAPFSLLNESDRILTVLVGRMELIVGHEQRVVTLQPGQPFAFPGEAAVAGRPVEGRMRNFNVLVRRDVWHARVEPWCHGLPTTGLRIILATEACGILQPLDAAMLSEGEESPSDFVGLQVTLMVATR